MVFLNGSMVGQTDANRLCFMDVYIMRWCLLYLHGVGWRWLVTCYHQSGKWELQKSALKCANVSKDHCFPNLHLRLRTDCVTQDKICSTHSFIGSPITSYLKWQSHCSADNWWKLMSPVKCRDEVMAAGWKQRASNCLRYGHTWEALKARTRKRVDELLRLCMPRAVNPLTFQLVQASWMDIGVNAVDLEPWRLLRGQALSFSNYCKMQELAKPSTTAQKTHDILTTLRNVTRLSK